MNAPFVQTDVFVSNVLSRYTKYRDEANYKNRARGRGAIGSEVAEDLFLRAVQETTNLVRTAGQLLPANPTDLAYDMYAERCLERLPARDLRRARVDFERVPQPRTQHGWRKRLYEVIPYRRLIAILGGHFEINLVVNRLSHD